MSLKDSWQAGKQQRQQELAQRQQLVAQTLLVLQQQRQHTASHLHCQLAQFRDGLSQQEQVRREEFQSFQAEVQQYCALLQQETNELLDTIAVDRALMSQQLCHELQAFHQDLQANVRSLRTSLQHDSAISQADTQTFLTTCQQHRSQTKLEVETTLQQSREQRQAEVATLFASLHTFRAELRQFQQSLKDDVWGQSQPFVAVKPRTPSKITAIPTAQTVVAQSVTVKSTAVKSTTLRTRAPGKTTLPKGASQIAAKLATVAKPPAVAKAIATTKASLASLPSASSVAVDDVAFEQEVYTFLHTQQGARLTQIEAALKLNRFQAVDALRSLIKKGLITQRDRVYLISRPNP